jgi:LPS-assembly protein
MREGYLAYSRPWLGDGSVGVVGRLQRYQTLQDPLAPVGIPYARLPQVNVSAAKQVLGGTDFAASGEYVDFAHPTNVIGKRISAYPTLSLPLLSSGAYLTPKIGYNWARYDLQRTAPGADTSITRAMPTFTVDSGMTFDRNVNFRGQGMVQTLEPRLYYVYIPYRGQNNIPLFDTGVADLNYSQIFSENSFSGNDRINDANQLTAAVTTRLLQPNGQELVRAIVGQRYYFKNQEVTLNPTDTPRTYTASDWLAAASGRVARSWMADTAIQYNARLNRTERFSVGTRYQPEVQKVMNLGYRYNRDILHQVDASAQWPLGGGWYGLGRLNFSIKDHKLIEGLAGFEYDAGCWIARVVVQSFATGVGTSNNTLFLQLELNGFSRIGSNPLEALKRNISGYSQLNKPADPNRPLNFYD